MQLRAAGDGKGAGTLAALAERCRPEEAGLESALDAVLLQLAALVSTSYSVSSPGSLSRGGQCRGG